MEALDVTSHRARERAWALYDWANSAFATTVMAGFFPVFFKQFWNAGVDPAVSTFRLGVANSVASIVVAVLAPLLGAVADRGAGKKRFLLFFAGLGVCTTGSLYWVAQGEWLAAGILYAAGTIGFAGGNVFYDALLVSVTASDRFDRVSALGYALGYLGGGILFAVNVFMVTQPTLFGLEDAASAVRLSFLMVAGWWAVFSIPLFRRVPEPRLAASAPWGVAAREGLREVWRTLQHLRRYRPVWLFLISYWLYIDGVDTIIKMAVDYGMGLGFEAADLMKALLLTQFVGAFAALGFGRLGQHLGPKTGIYIALVGYCGITVWGYFMRGPLDFYGLAVAVGLVQGGIQALSRSLFARLVPPQHAGEFFGFYNMLGKFATILGPVLMGWVALATGSARVSILAILALFVAGGVVFWFVPVPGKSSSANPLEPATTPHG